MAKLVDGYFRLLKALIALCLVLMVALVFGNVVLRYAFNTGLTLSEELSRWLFVYLVFLGAVVAMREHGHLGMDGLVKRLPAAGKKACLVASHLLMLWATWLLLQGSWVQTQINLGTTAPSSGLPVAVVYAVGLVYGVSVGAILLADLWRVLSGAVADDELVMVRESEELEELEQLEASFHPAAAAPREKTA
ncbi:TRAP transporter small permease [Ramlibacter sp. 2FC]|uniref:TRAP transporter small permease n=1 Tax=Ramlibacter sp. 2FC TaxID=2502188 RepID=UPI0010F89052|nr:TRAP transporter small permease [Ramlibacter sp. 2FC]